MSKEHNIKKIIKNVIDYILIALAMGWLIRAVIYYYPYDFKCFENSKKTSGIDWNKIELMEQSTTPDNSVCIVSQMNQNEKDMWKDDCTLYCNKNQIYRISSDEFIAFKINISDRKFDYSADSCIKKYQLEKKNPGMENYFLKYDNARLNECKVEYYDIHKKKVAKKQDLLKILRNIFGENKLLNIQPYSFRYLGTTDNGKVKLGFYYVCGVKKKYIQRENCTLCQDNANNYYVTSSVYKNEPEEALANKKLNYKGLKLMDKNTFKNLLKKNGIDTKNIYYSFNQVDYNEVNLWIKTEGLPKENARLYKVYPKLKKYIGQKDKWARLFIKGKTSDEIAEYFLPEGKKISYGDGVNLENNIQVTSLDDYMKKAKEIDKKEGCNDYD